MSEVIVDTNVAVVANGFAQQASDGCVEQCVDELERIVNGCVVVLDSDGLILDEYQKILNFSGHPGAGDAFFKWLFFNQANPEHCRKVAITPHADRGFEEFPDDSALANFDRDDRKFIAVALASKTAPDTQRFGYRLVESPRHLEAARHRGVIFMPRAYGTG